GKLTPYIDVTTADTQVIRRDNLLIDADAVRTSETSATDAERDAALRRSADVMEFLSALHFPLPLVGDSGNGGHLVYKLDLPPTEEFTLLLHEFLEALARRFSDKAVTIDAKVFNLARITKIFGTLARKGSNVPER